MEEIINELKDNLQEASSTFEKDIKEFIRKFVEEIVNSLLKSELTTFLSYEKYERNKSDGNYRNGYYERAIQTAFGEIRVKFPTDRLREFKNKLIAPYRRRTEGFEERILEIANSGMSHSTIVDLLKSLYGVSYSTSTISLIAEDFEKEVEKFKNRKLDDEYYAIYLDGTYLPIRRGDIQKECILMALGIKMDGSREVLGYLINPSENIASYRELLGNLKARGMKDNKIFITDGFSSLGETIKELFPKSDIQRCLVHVMRDFNSKVKIEDRGMITKEFKSITASKDMEEAKDNFKEFTIKWDKKYRSLKSYKLNPDTLFCFLKYPRDLHKILNTTNPIESINKQIKRRLKVREISTENSLNIDLTYIFIRYNAKSKKIPNYELIDRSDGI